MRAKPQTFIAFLTKSKSKYGDTVYCFEVQWLSRGVGQQRFLSLLEENKSFLIEKASSV
jgi:hypothetical protein